MEVKTDKNYCLQLVEDGGTTPALPVSLFFILGVFDPPKWWPRLLPGWAQLGCCVWKLKEVCVSSYLAKGAHFLALKVLEAGREGLTLASRQR